MLPQAIAVMNGKGGVGKTSVTANAGALAAANGWRVLAVDLDSQGNLGRDLGYLTRGHSDNGAGLLDAMMRGRPLEPLREVRPNLDVIPAGDETDDLVHMLAGRVARDPDTLAALEAAIAPIADDYNLILFDCPPQVGVIQDAALRTSRFVVVPTTFDDGSLDGLTRVAKRFRQALAYNPELELLGVVLFNFGTRATAVIGEVREVIAEGLGEVAPILGPPIRSAQRAARDMRHRGELAHEYEGARASLRLSEAAPGLAGDYQRLTTELLQAFRLASLRNGEVAPS